MTLLQKAEIDVGGNKILLVDTDVWWEERWELTVSHEAQSTVKDEFILLLLKISFQDNPSET